VVLFETFSFGGMPYAGLSNEQTVAAVLGGRRLEQPAECPDAIFSLMLQAWAYKASNRPSFAWVVEYLHRVTKRVLAGSEDADLLCSARLSKHGQSVHTPVDGATKRESRRRRRQDPRPDSAASLRSSDMYLDGDSAVEVNPYVMSRRDSEQSEFAPGSTASGKDGEQSYDNAPAFVMLDDVITNDQVVLGPASQHASPCGQRLNGVDGLEDEYLNILPAENTDDQRDHAAYLTPVAYLNVYNTWTGGELNEEFPFPSPARPHAVDVVTNRGGLSDNDECAGMLAYGTSVFGQQTAI
jgi:hypothetical protein